MDSAGIRVLGPLTVGGNAAGLAPRDRVVLAVLALRPGEVVSAEQLAEALWGEQPPVSWHKVVPGCVMRLRRAMGAEAIETVAEGYRLVVPGDEVDARRFERLVGRVRELLTLGRTGRSAHLAGEGLRRCGGAAPSVTRSRLWCASSHTAVRDVHSTESPAKMSLTKPGRLP